MRFRCGLDTGQMGEIRGELEQTLMQRQVCEQKGRQGRQHDELIGCLIICPAARIACGQATNQNTSFLFHRHAPESGPRVT